MTKSSPDDLKFMAAALELARQAGAAGEVPIGAVLVREGETIAAAANAPIATHDPSAHAEVLALRAAGREVANYRLPHTTLYATLEPCAMCAGALIHARVDRLVFGASDPRRGAAGSALDLFSHASANHRVQVAGGVLAEECGTLLREFFRERRGR
jgi:tRNA(adenine34) deaminase